MTVEQNPVVFFLRTAPTAHSLIAVKDDCDIPDNVSPSLVSVGDGYGDRELAAETTARLVATIDTHRSVIAVSTASSDYGTLIEGSSHNPSLRRVTIPQSRLAVTSNVPLLPYSLSVPENVSLASSYHSIEPVRRLMKRTTMTGIPFEDEHVNLTRLREAFGSSMFVKSAYSKSGSGIVNLDASDHDVEMSVLNIFGEFCYVMPKALCQEVLTIEYEHRFFVVNNEVVTGAGRIETDTPVVHGDSRFTHQFSSRCQRFPDSTTIEHRAPFDAVGFTQDAARAISDSPLDTYCLDVGWCPQRGPVIVELNTIYSAGLYQCNPWLLMESLAQHPVTVDFSWDWKRELMS